MKHNCALLAICVLFIGVRLLQQTRIETILELDTMHISALNADLAVFRSSIKLLLTELNKLVEDKNRDSSTLVVKEDTFDALKEVLNEANETYKFSEEIDRKLTNPSQNVGINTDIEAFIVKYKSLGKTGFSSAEDKLKALEDLMAYTKRMLSNNLESFRMVAITKLSISIATFEKIQNEMELKEGPNTYDIPIDGKLCAVHYLNRDLQKAANDVSIKVDIAHSVWSKKSGSMLTTTEPKISDTQVRETFEYQSSIRFDSEAENHIKEAKFLTSCKIHVHENGSKLILELSDVESDHLLI